MTSHARPHPRSLSVMLEPTRDPRWEHVSCTLSRVAPSSRRVDMVVTAGGVRAAQTGVLGDHHSPAGLRWLLGEMVAGVDATLARGKVAGS